MTTGLVKFTDNGALYDAHKDEYLSAIDSVLSSGNWQGDDSTREFEELLKEDTNSKHALMVSSGTEALYLSMRALKSDKTDVICPAFSFPATASTILRAGMKPVFVDVDYAGKLAYPSDGKIPDSVGLIIPVNIFGFGFLTHPKETHPDFYNRYIYDNAQGYQGKYTQEFGKATALSFDPMKNLPAFGSAGAIVTDDDFLAFLLKGLRKNDPYSTIPSQNSQASAATSAGLIVSRRYLHDWQYKRLQIANNYIYGLSGSLGALDQSMLIPSSHHKFPIFHEKRDQLKHFLSTRGIETKIHYPYTLPELEQFGGMSEEDAKEKFPHAYRISRTELSLPIHPAMESEQVKHVIDSVNTFVENNY